VGAIEALKEIGGFEGSPGKGEFKKARP